MFSPNEVLYGLLFVGVVVVVLSIIGRYYVSPAVKCPKCGTKMNPVNMGPINYDLFICPNCWTYRYADELDE